MIKINGNNPLSEETINYYKSFNIFVKTEEDLEKIKIMAEAFPLIRKTAEVLLPKRIESYNSIIRDLVVFLRQMGINESIEMCNIFSYMLWSGTFSKDNSYSFNIKPANVFRVLDNFGIPIISGEGVCLNNSAMLDDVLQEANMFSLFMVNKANHHGKMEYLPKAKKVIKNKTRTEFMIKLLLKLSTGNNGNHVCEIIIFNGEYYLYDPTNFIVFPLDETLDLTALNGTLGSSLRPAGSIILGKLSIEDLYKFKEVYLTQTPREEAAQMVKELFEKDLDFFKTNAKLFSDFRGSISDRIDIINDPQNNEMSFWEFMKEFKRLSEEEGKDYGFTEIKSIAIECLKILRYIK